MPCKRRLAIAALLLPLAVVQPAVLKPAWAQGYNRPPADVGDDNGGDAPMDRGPAGGGMDAADPALASVRIGKLETRIREMTGQIEELQNANRKLAEQMQKFQADVEFRLQDKGGRPAKRTEAAPGPDAASPAVADRTPAVAPAPTKQRRDDTFDPGMTPDAPGVPKPLGSTASATPPDDAPMDLTGAGLRAAPPGPAGAIAPALPLPSAAAPSSAGATVTPNGTIIANVAPNTPKGEFDVALGYYKDKQYENAEKGFTAFIDKNPKSRLVADATYFIGETFAQRGRPREAAEQYLKISTDYANSARAPEAMLHLGVSLKALGAKEQACATFTEVARKYPNAPPYVKTGAEREAKRAQC